MQAMFDDIVQYLEELSHSYCTKWSDIASMSGPRRSASAEPEFLRFWLEKDRAGSRTENKTRTKYHEQLCDTGK